MFVERGELLIIDKTAISRENPPQNELVKRSEGDGFRELGKGIRMNGSHDFLHFSIK